MKQIASQELQVEKGRNSRREQYVILEVSHELQVVKQTLEEEMEGQKA